MNKNYYFFFIIILIETILIILIFVKPIWFKLSYYTSRRKGKEIQLLNNIFDLNSLIKERHSAVIFNDDKPLLKGEYKKNIKTSDYDLKLTFNIDKNINPQEIRVVEFQLEGIFKKEGINIIPLNI